MINSMGKVVDAFWRAAAYCLHPRVIALSLLPLLLTSGLAFALGYFYWESAVDAVRATLDSWRLIDTLLGWLNYVGANDFRSALAPILVLVLALPVLVVLSLLLVALLMTPSMVDLVAQRRKGVGLRRHVPTVWTAPRRRPTGRPSCGSCTGRSCGLGASPRRCRGRSSDAWRAGSRTWAGGASSRAPGAP